MCRVVSDQPLLPVLVLQQTAVNLENKMGMFTGFSFLSQGFMSKTTFIPVLTAVVTQDERNCDHKTGKTSKQENHFSMGRPIG